jgi:hypothetical protein
MMETTSCLPVMEDKGNENMSPVVYQFFCTNPACAEKEREVFRLEIPCEAILDEKNMATPFCGKCGKPLRRSP